MADSVNKRKVVMDKGVQDLFQRLIHNVIDRVSPVSGMTELKSFLAAMVNPENLAFAGEPIHELKERLDKRPALPTELLLRVTDMGGEFMETALGQLDELNDLGAIHAFDTAVTLAAIDHAIQKRAFPVSINVSTKNIENPQFWNDLDHLLESHFYSPGCCKRTDITFELLEGKKEYFESFLEFDAQTNSYKVKPDYKEKLDFMMKLKERGYRFSMDDMTDKEEDAARDILYRDLVDNFKMDWKTTKKVLSNNADQSLSPRLAFCRENSKNIIFEGVRNSSEASFIMKEFQAAGAQGRDLDENRHAFNHAFNVACCMSGDNVMDAAFIERKHIITLLLGTSARPALTMTPA